MFDGKLYKQRNIKIKKVVNFSNKERDDVIRKLKGVYCFGKKG